jgi:hypothetical protein
MIGRLLLIVLLVILLVSQAAAWVILSRIQGDIDYERMRTVHRGELGQTYR